MNLIESSAKIIGEVDLGNRNYIGHNSVLIGPLKLGDDNYIGNMVVIGTSAQDDILSSEEHWPSLSQENLIIIGNGNVIREFTTVHRGLASNTTIGDYCYLMSYSHIAHDCKIGDSVKIANAVQLGGFTTVLPHAYLGLSSVIHQFTVIGHASMVGMNSTVVKSCRPGSTVVGSPARFVKPNTKGMQKLGLTNGSWWDSPDDFPTAYKALFDQFEEEVSKRQTESIEIRKWRAEFLRKVK